jgi:hypothetical protein
MVLACAPFCAEIMLAGYFGTYIYYEDGLSDFTNIHALYLILIQMGARVLTDPLAAFLFKHLPGKLLIFTGFSLLILSMASLIYAKTTTT